MGPIWGRQDPGGPHELCYLGCRQQNNSPTFIADTPKCSYIVPGEMMWSTFAQSKPSLSIAGLLQRSIFALGHTPRVINSFKSGHDFPDNSNKTFALRFTYLYRSARQCLEMLRGWQPLLFHNNNFLGPDPRRHIAYNMFDTWRVPDSRVQSSQDLEVHEHLMTLVPEAGVQAMDN